MAADPGLQITGSAMARERPWYATPPGRLPLGGRGGLT